MQIYDLTLYNGEWEQFEIRYRELEDIVDQFIVFETDQSMNGKKKPFHTTLERSHYPKLRHVQREVAQSIGPNFTSWDIERFHRDYLITLTDEVHGSPQDLLLLSDIDEIPSYKSVAFTRDLLCSDNEYNTVYKFEQRMFYYYFNTPLHVDWHGTRMLKRRTLMQNFDGELSRVRHADGPLIKNAGWHFSTLGPAENIANKITDFTHQELNTAYYNNVRKIQSHMDLLTDLYDRDIKMSWEPIDDTYPACFEDAELVKYFTSLGLIRESR